MLLFLPMEDRAEGLSGHIYTYPPLSLRFYSGPFMSLSYSEGGGSKLNKIHSQAEEKAFPELQN